jgi:hypothetical protein
VQKGNVGHVHSWIVNEHEIKSRSNCVLDHQREGKVTTDIKKAGTAVMRYANERRGSRESGNQYDSKERRGTFVGDTPIHNNTDVGTIKRGKGNYGYQGGTERTQHKTNAQMQKALKCYAHKGDVTLVTTISPVTTSPGAVHQRRSTGNNATTTFGEGG